MLRMPRAHAAPDLFPEWMASRALYSTMSAAVPSRTTRRACAIKSSADRLLLYRAIAASVALTITRPLPASFLRQMIGGGLQPTPGKQNRLTSFLRMHHRYVICSSRQGFKAPIGRLVHAAWPGREFLQSWHCKHRMKAAPLFGDSHPCAAKKRRRPERRGALSGRKPPSEGIGDGNLCVPKRSDDFVATCIEFPGSSLTNQAP